MADIYLFPAEANAADVRLREPTADTPVTPPVISGPVWAPARSRRRPPVQPRRPVTHHETITARCHTRVAVTMSVDHAGRRQHEDELVLVGAI